MELNFLYEKNILVKLKRKTTFASMCLVMKTSCYFQSTFQIKNSMDLLLLIDKNKSHYVYIKDFGRFTFHKTKKQKQKILLRKLLTVF